ncbi:type III pantothenate kinase [Cyclobacterium sp.]|uniref:type III pantothenate kinase n=1 Tax=Cyclobacterium sp. TaxID=1966343 RepID=UPI0019C827DC|nr:type III pantothenate kinase [Cyclobacterium sp.]MBD3629591.1 type III pantothenate kinase [Cyclobacterium sp.]
MFLSVDAGNSNIVFGIYEESSDSWLNVLRVETTKKLSVLQLEKALGLFFLENGLHPDTIDGIGVSTVVPDLKTILLRCTENFFGRMPYMINEKSYDKLPVKTSNPEEIGSDLMANITAAYDCFKEACIVVDFGTALTFSIIDSKGNVIGINIVPGIKTAINSLFTGTARLPKVSLEMPDSVLGKNTVHAIQAGIFYGYTGLVKGMLASISAETQMKFKVLATGGLSPVMQHLSAEFDLMDIHLTLKGIYQITRINCKKG